MLDNLSLSTIIWLILDAISQRPLALHYLTEFAWKFHPTSIIWLPGFKNHWIQSISLGTFVNNMLDLILFSEWAECVWCVFHMKLKDMRHSAAWRRMKFHYTLRSYNWIAVDSTLKQWSQLSSYIWGMQVYQHWYLDSQRAFHESGNSIWYFRWKNWFRV